MSKQDWVAAGLLIAVAVTIAIFDETAAYVFLGAVGLVGIATHYQTVKAVTGL